MALWLHLIAYASVAVFAVAIVVRVIRIQRYPLHVRWELYPVPHEGKRADHGGSRLEEGDWWTKEHKPSTWSELKFMIPEMIFIKGLWEHNRRLWYRSFPFHFGLYLMVAFAALVLAGAILEVMGIGPLAMLHNLIYLIGVVGMALGIGGGLALLIMRLSDRDLVPYTNLSHIFNLLLISIALGVTLSALITEGLNAIRLFQDFAVGMLTLRLGGPAAPTQINVSLLLLSVLIAYIPLTHMSHFFVKWFTWHKIRWDDEPNVKGGRIEVMIQKSLNYPVSWSAPHIRGDGKKTWADVATEEVQE